MVGVGILALLGAGAAQLVLSLSVESNAVTNRVEASADLLLLDQRVRRTLGMTQLRWYGFGNDSSADRPLLRMVFSLPGTCANLEATESCKSSSTLVYAHFDRDAAYQTKAHCLLPGPSPHLIVDAPPTGVTLSPYLGVILPPRVVGLRTTGLAELDPLQNAQTGAPYPPECFRFAERSATNAILTSRLRVMSITPLTTQFSKPGAVANEALSSALVRFPGRMRALSFSSIGPSPDGRSLEVRGCQLSPPAKLDCISPPDVSLSGLRSIAIAYSFRLDLPGRAGVRRFVVSDGVSPSLTFCVPPNCGSLAHTPSGGLPLLVTPSESLQSPDGQTLSGLKLEILDEIYLEIELEGGRSVLRYPMP
jgi:hypothetical protein